MLPKLIIKNALRHKLRTFLTVLGIAIAVGAFGLLRTVITSWYASVEVAAADRLICRQAVSFIFPLPYAYRDKIAKIPGVQMVTYQNWFQGVYIDKEQFFPRMAVDPNTMFDVYPEFTITREELENFKKERNACVLGIDIANKYGLKIGDIMNVEGDIYPGQWQFVIRGIYKPRAATYDGTQMFFHWEYLDERMKQEMPARAGYVGWYVIKIAKADDAAMISEQVDALFQNSPAETKTETEKAFQNSFLKAYSAIITAINTMAILIIGVFFLVLANTMIMSSRERSQEYAVMKTLGFTAKHIFGLVTGESMVIGLLGGVAGYFVTNFFVNAFSMVVPKNWFPVFVLDDITLIQEFAFAVLVGLVAGFIPSYATIKSSIIDGLRHIA